MSGRSATRQGGGGRGERRGEVKGLGVRENGNGRISYNYMVHLPFILCMYLEGSRNNLLKVLMVIKGRRYARCERFIVVPPVVGAHRRALLAPLHGQIPNFCTL